DEKLEILLAFADKKLEGFENATLSVDKGIDVTDGNSRGLVVHSDVPQEIIDKLESALEEAKNKESYLKYEEENYLHLRDGWLNSDDYQSQLKEDVKTYESILKDLQ